MILERDLIVVTSVRVDVARRRSAERRGVESDGPAHAPVTARVNMALSVMIATRAATIVAIWSEKYGRTAGVGAVGALAAGGTVAAVEPANLVLEQAVVGVANRDLMLL
jgi:hypothetical protein